MTLLSVKNLSVTFSSRGQKLHAVRDISFSIEEGKSVGIVGESGCGKSATAAAIMGLCDGAVQGDIEFAEKVIPGKTIGMIFQDPMTSLNPTMKIGAQITEGFLYHKMGTPTDAKAKAIELLHLTGVHSPEERFSHYPHQLSGGQRQRALIAMALMCGPKLLIADEATTALDSATRIQILELLKKLKDHFQMSLLIISHDMSVIESAADTTLVMYAGKIVERGPTLELLKNPRHPYTQMLLASLPKNRKKSEPLQGIEGAPPNLTTLPVGCAFKDRCPYAAIKCREEPKGPIACWRAP